MTAMPSLMEGTRGHCEVGQSLADRLGLGPSMVRALGQAFERWDGKGEPEGLRGEQVAVALRAEVREGRLDAKAVDAVLAAAGHETSPRKRAWPAGLSDREVEVLCLMARGLSKREMAGQLFLSPATVDHHIRHIYNKIGMSTRAGATLFAVQHDLVRHPEISPEK